MVLWLSEGPRLANSDQDDHKRCEREANAQQSQVEDKPRRVSTEVKKKESREVAWNRNRKEENAKKTERDRKEVEQIENKTKRMSNSKESEPREKTEWQGTSMEKVQ